MIWLSTFAVAVLSAALGGFAAGLVASGGVKWYRISKFEGGAGYFVVFMALLGVVSGLLIGVITSLSVWADSGGGFLKALAIAWGIILLIAGIVAVISRLLADVPPTIDGQELLLVVDVRWPADQSVSPAAVASGDAFIVLNSLFGSTVRKSERGVLWVGEAQQIDGRWTARGVVNIFTSRGQRMLQIHTGSGFKESFHLPLPAFPRNKSHQWSDWLPRRNSNGTSSTLTFRFRAQRWSEPTRTEMIGPFEIATVTRSIFESVDHGRQVVDSDDRFRITHRGRPVALGDVSDDPNGVPLANMIATFPGHPTTLLVNMSRHYEPGKMYLLHEDDGGAARVELVGESTPVPSLIFMGPGMAGDDSGIKRNRRRIDRDGIFHVAPRAIVDSRTMASFRYASPANDVVETGDFKPLALSPDERSYVRITLNNRTFEPNVTATDFVADRSDTLPIDRRRMRFTRTEQLDLAWVMHHFCWERADDGFDRLVEKTDFAPLPYHGDLEKFDDGRRLYRVDRVTAAMWATLDRLLVSKFNTTSKVVEGSFDHEFVLGGLKVSTCYIEGSQYAMVWMDAAMKPEDVAKIVQGLDQELATGRFDDLFVPPQ